MGPRRDIVLLSLVVLCLSSSTIGASLLAPSNSLVYNYEAEIKAQADNPSPAASSFTLRGLLTIETGTAVNAANVKLSDISTTLFNGALIPSDEPRSEFLPLQDQAGELSKEFTVYFDGGVVVGLTGTDGEAEWAVNMKRSLASLLQLDMSKLDNSSSFIVKENGLYGACDTEYTIQREEKEYIVRKFVDHSSCPSYPTKSWNNNPPIEVFCPTGRENIISSSGGRIYTVRADGAAHTIMRVEATGNILAQPFKARGDLQTLVTRQVLTFKSAKDLTTPPTMHPGQLTDLTFRLPGLDFSQGRAPMKQATAITLTKRLLGEINDNLDKTMSHDVDKLHDERIPQILYFMTLLERKSLEDLFNEYAVGTSYRQETLRNLFNSLLPQVGTSDSILLMRDLIVARSIKNQLSQAFLNKLPFYLRRPSEELLRQCETFYTLDKEYDSNTRAAAILSFATLVYKTCGTNCAAETQDKYVRKYLDLFTAAETYQSKMLYLEGLSNMEDGKVFDYLEPVIRSNPDSHLRFLAVWATMNKAAYHPDEVYNLYWPILSNRSSLLEMRVAALTMLVVSKPSAARFFSLHWFMSSEPEPRLKHFYYTTLQSLINTKDPCYSLMSTFAAQVLRLLPAPSQRHWSTGNYILDHANPELGFGGMAQLFLIANQKTELPNVFYLMLGDHAVGQRYNQFSVYLKLEGVSNAVKERLLRINPNNVNIPQLADILRKMKATPTTDEPVHFELLIKREGRVVLCLHLDGTTFHKLADELHKVVTMPFDINLNVQNVATAFLNERIIPTDLGTSALYLLSSTSYISQRGIFSQVVTASSYSASKNIEFRYSGTTVGSLMLYNPVIDMWQAVQRSTTLQAILPFEGNAHIDAAQRIFNFNVTKKPDLYTGVLVHMRSTVFVRGVGAAKRLRSHCESCQALVTVSQGEKYRDRRELLDLEVNEVGAHLKGELFDCEHHNGFEALYAAVRTQNYRVFPASRPFMIVAHLLSSCLMVSPPGSCGTEVQLTTIENQTTTIEGSIQLTNNNNRHSASLSLAHKTGIKTLHSWHVDADCQHDNSFYNLSLNVVRNAPTEDMRKICMSALVNFPAYPSDKYLVKASEPLTAEATFRWASLDGAGICDGDDLPLQVTFRAETTVEQAAVASAAKIWPFNACKAGNNADACHQAAREMATLRKYSVALNYSEPLEPALFILGRAEDGQLLASIEVPTVRPVVLVTIGSDTLTLGTGRYWIEPFLLNTHYPAVQQVAMALGLMKPAESDKVKK